LIEASPQLTRIAIDPLMKFYQHHGLLPNRPGVDGMVFIESPGELLPLADEVADVVCCCNCLDHVEDPWLTLAQIVRILKINGCLFLDVDCGGKTDYMHPQSFSAEEVVSHAKELGMESVLVRGVDAKMRKEGGEEISFCFRRLESSRATFPARAKQPRLGELTPILVTEGVHQYNILALPDPSTQTLYIGIRQSEGPFDYDKFFSNSYTHPVFRGSSEHEVRHKIEQSISDGAA
jgi:SAM-dependent methyltransferase